MFEFIFGFGLIYVVSRVWSENRVKADIHHRAVTQKATPLYVLPGIDAQQDRHVRLGISDEEALKYGIDFTDWRYLRNQMPPNRNFQDWRDPRSVKDNGARTCWEQVKVV